MENDASLNMLMAILPEIALIAMGTWCYLGSAFAKRAVDWSMFAVLAFAVAGLWLGYQASMIAPQLAGEGAPVASGPIVLDVLSLVVRVLTVMGGLALALAATNSGGNRLSGEFQGSLLMAAAGVMLASGAMDLVVLFVALELISIPTYVILFLSRDGEQSAEATVKYFFLSIVSSAIMLYGFTLLYGLAGSTMLTDVLAALRGAGGASAVLAAAAMTLSFAGLGFKIAAVPFHFYAPDVYQGTSNAGAGLLAVFPKIAGIVVLVRLAACVPGVENYGWQLALVLAVLTMTLGNFVALWQKSVRRLLAYSSIAHSGYMLIGLTAAFNMAAGGEPLAPGLSAMLFYLVVYVLATAGAFAALAYLSDDQRQVDKVEDLSGLVKTHPLAAAAMGVCMFSLTGIPPLAGFWGKLSLFGAALESAWLSADATQRGWLVALVVIAAINAAVSAGYYLRIVGVMFFASGDAQRTQRGPTAALGAATVCAAAVLAVGLYPGWLFNAASSASRAAITTAKEYEPYQAPEEDFSAETAQR